jgi:hypothetical protein
MDLPFDQWTSCEMYGHLFVQDDEGSRFSHCSDCGEEAEDVSGDEAVLNRHGHS